ncbi:S9 family peptidase [Pseudoxanthomonas indica]|uniref:Dipeptidyl aminopeptidase/acylaminoacyl peptidase n=1 Tax=Pseudoxanthomonas indica TaxID=428993 RepID=A0A1T5KQU4_9GAMM|nr:prolyl oligopeptidase family serine peptidase [Pseudoxanthomonas indica]GGD50924.1 peptidase [Pseudoxanthomonas indica]SKC66144.1 Dipeptidyl aminopeptidase/acylaminoacyl peptidase [Pseudoxanthomonas indica]
MTPFAPRCRALARCVRSSCGRSLLAALLLISLQDAAAAQSPAESDAALHAAVRSEQARPRPPRFSRAQFLATPVMAGAWLSPDGRGVAYLQEQGGRRSLWRLDARGGKPQRMLAQTQASDVVWSHDGQWIFLQDAAGIHAVAMDQRPGSGLILGESGKQVRRLAGADRSRAEAALILESPPSVSRQTPYWRILRIDVTRAQQLLWQDTRPIVDFAVDAHGRLAWLLRAEGDQHVLYRLSGTRLLQQLRCVRVERCLLLASSADGQAVYLNTDSASGFGRLARLQASGQLDTLHQDPRGEADLQQVSLDPLTGEPLFANYRSTIAASHPLDAGTRAQWPRIRRQLAQPDLRIEVGRGADARWLIHARQADAKGERLYLYNPGNGQLHEILGELGFEHERRAVTPLPSDQLARKLPVSWRGSDGMLLHGFVLLPPGVDARRAPLVANIHGGPFNLFRPEFGAQSQLLANRGYVVFEPNFRGSTGLGRDYLLAAGGDFGNGRVQQDIVEGVRHLLAQGVGDAGKVGIVGASFGGYSALQGVTFQPALFKVGVAAVPPADFGWVLRWYARGPDQMSRGVPMASTMRLLALDPADGALAARLRVQSPIANAAALRRPVLLLAGGDDERVPIRSVVHYAAQLKAQGKQVSLFVDAEGRHQLVNPLTREAYLYLLEAMFQRHLGGPAPAPPSRALREVLARNLLLDGDHLRVQ